MVGSERYKWSRTVHFLGRGGAVLHAGIGTYLRYSSGIKDTEVVWSMDWLFIYGNGDLKGERFYLRRLEESHEGFILGGNL